MPARVVAEEFIQEPDQSINPDTRITASDFQDCALICEAFEKGMHYSSTEETVYAPIARQVQNLKYWSKANQEVLGSWFSTPKQQDSEDSAQSQSGLQIQNTFTSIEDENFGDALKKIYEDCVPCNDRLDLGVTFKPQVDLLAVFENDIKEKINFLTDLDSLLSNVNVYGDLCRLLSFLNFMCVPDLQRMVSVLMALTMKFNLSLDGLYSLIASLITPIFSPVISGVTNLLSQYEQLVLNPINCVIDSADETLRRLSIDTGPAQTSDEITPVRERLSQTQEDINTSVGAGLGLLRNKLFEADALVREKLTFYLDQINKMTGDINGDQTAILSHSLDKLQVVRLIALVQAIIDLKRKGGQLCQEGDQPSAEELDTFLNNFLNENSFFKITVDDDGNLRIEEPDPVTYRLEDEEDGAKIVAYEPDNLLQVPVQVTIDCNIIANQEDVDKINQWIKELDEVEK